MHTVVYEFLKKNWAAILLVVLLCVGYAWIRHQQAQTAAIIRELDNSHQVELEKIIDARAKEEAAHAAQVKILLDSLAKIQAEYEVAQLELERQKNVQRKEIVKKYSNDVDGLAQLAAEKLGLLVMPSTAP